MLDLVNRTCTLCDELAIQFMLASEQVREARGSVHRAVTQMQMATAETFLERARAYESYSAGELRSHRERCMCVEPEVDELVASIV